MHTCFIVHLQYDSIRYMYGIYRRRLLLYIMLIFLLFFLLSRFNLHCSLDIDSVGSFTHCFFRLWAYWKVFSFYHYNNFIDICVERHTHILNANLQKVDKIFCFCVSIHSPICFCSILFLFTSQKHEKNLVNEK